MKYLGKITDDKDLVTKEYVDNAVAGGGGGGSGTVTSVGITEGTGISVSGSPITTSGNITVGHSNSTTARTTQAIYPVKIDAQGHITASGNAASIGTVKQSNVNKKITTTGIDTYTEGTSITLEAGTWVVIGTWVFNTGSSTGARNMTCALSTSSGSANSGMLARTRVYANTNAWASLQATYLATLSSSTTIYVKGSSTMTYTSESNVDIRAVRII